MIRISQETWVLIASLNLTGLVVFSSVQFSRLLMSDSLWPQGLQHIRPPCPSPTSGCYSDSCPLSRWCHPTISSSVIPFSHLQSFPPSEPFQMSQLFASLISWLKSPSAVILEPSKIKSATVSTVSPFAMKWWDWMHDLCFLNVEP